MRTLRILALAMCLTACFSAFNGAQAKPVEIYQITLTPGTDAYRYAASHGWPMFYASDNVALTAGQAAALPLGSSVKLLYKGESSNLEWVFQKRENGAPFRGPALFQRSRMALVESRYAEIPGTNFPGGYQVSMFSGEPITPVQPEVVINPALTRDSDIAALAALIDTGQVRADEDSLQAFNTRSAMAANHPAVIEWLRQQFLAMGIADVRTDSMNISGYPVGHNVIATIPGTLDTQSVYIVGGHFDTSVWPFNPAFPWAPGADDNGSGTVAVLEMARVLATNPPKATVRLIALDGEEWGLYGSAYYAQRAAAQDRQPGERFGIP